MRLFALVCAVALAGCSSSSNPSPASNRDSGSGGGAGQSGACLGSADGIAVADVDLDGFPSYAVDGCRLLYVAAGSNELRLRPLDGGAEVLIAPASDNPRRPTLAGDVMAWEADQGGVGVVRVRSAGQTKTLSGNYDHAGEPRATTDAVVFTAWTAAASDSDSDVYLYSPASDASTLLAGGPGQQRFADVSPTHAAISDFSEDPSGIYSGDGTSLANVIVIDRATSASKVRSLAGKQAFPMLGSAGTLAYLEWLEVHPVPKLQDYTIQAVPLATLDAQAQQIAHVQSDQAVRPTARAGRIEWVVRTSGASSLWRAAFDTGTPAEVPLGNVAVIHAPSATTGMTVLAVRQTLTGAPTLLAIADSAN